MSETRPFTYHSYKSYLREKKLMGSYCADSNNTYLPPRAICPKSHSHNMEWVEMSGKGKIAGYTVITIGPSNMAKLGYDRQNPYCSGVVELEEGVKIAGIILGVDVSQPETIRVGTPVEVEFMEVGEGEEQDVLLAFRPAAN